MGESVEGEQSVRYQKIYDRHDMITLDRLPLRRYRARLVTFQEF